MQFSKCSVCKKDVAPDAPAYMYPIGMIWKYLEKIIFCQKCIHLLEEVKSGRIKIENVRVQESTEQEVRASSAD